MSICYTPQRPADQEEALEASLSPDIWRAVREHLQARSMPSDPSTGLPKFREVVFVEDLDSYIRENSSVDKFGHTEVHGLARRLSAGLASFHRRGFRGVERHGNVEIVSSSGGCWSGRQWLVAASPTQAVIWVASSSDPAAATLWVIDRGLDGIHKRFTWMARVELLRAFADGLPLPDGWVERPLTDDEESRYHDLHGGPVAVWITPDGEVILEDETVWCRGRAYGPDAALQDLDDIWLAPVVYQLD